MALYKVKAPGFYHGKQYAPGGKRSFLETVKPFPKGKVPSWLEEVNKNSDKKVAKNAKKSAEEKTKLDEELAKEKKILEDEAMFTGASEGPKEL